MVSQCALRHGHIRDKAGLRWPQRPLGAHFAEYLAWPSSRVNSQVSRMLGSVPEALF